MLTMTSPSLTRESGRASGRRLIGQIRIVGVDVLDDVAAGFLVALENGAEGGGVNVVGGFARVSAADEGVERGELADHLRDDVVQLAAIGDAIDEGQIAVAHGGPINALHVAVVEVVALQPPGIEKEAADTLAGVGGEGPVREIDLGLGHGLGVGEGGGLGVGVENEEVVVAWTRSFLRSSEIWKSLILGRSVSTSAPLLAMSKHWRARVRSGSSPRLVQQRRLSVACNEP